MFLKFLFLKFRLFRYGVKGKAICIRAGTLKWVVKYEHFSHTSSHLSDKKSSVGFIFWWGRGSLPASGGKCMSRCCLWARCSPPLQPSQPWPPFSLLLVLVYPASWSRSAQTLTLSHASTWLFPGLPPSSDLCQHMWLVLVNQHLLCIVSAFRKFSLAQSP